MLLPTQLPCRQAKERKGPCPHLVNGRQCRSQSCRQRSYHDYQQIQWWKQNPGKSRCQKGSNCAHLQTRTCLWTHPPGDQALQAQLKELMTRGLTYKETLDTTRLLELSQGFISISDHCDLASFNKVSSTGIAVPGCPPRFTPLSEPLVLECDANNKSLCFEFPRYTHPFEPLFRSVAVMSPDVNIFESADIVSNASNLRKLFHILAHKSMRAERYDVEMRGNTLLLSRWNEDPSLNDSLGHGAGFERKTCRYPADDEEILRRSLSHHRVVAYRFGGLRCVVQSEVDAYYCDCEKRRSTLSPHAVPFVPSGSPSPAIPTPTSGSPTRKHSISLSGPPSKQRPELAFAALRLDDPGDSPTFTPAEPDNNPTLPSPPLTPTSPLHPATDTILQHASAKIHIHHLGRNIPSPCLIEVKTHKALNTPLFTPDAQLYFSRRTQLYDAPYHDKGVFLPGPGLVVQDRTGALRVWEREEQETLRKLAALLKMVRDKVREMVEKGVERVGLVVCQGEGGSGRVVVEVYDRGRGVGLVPADV
ncbi:hypothetical protein N656DRAFT_717007 [Canariomyces notabilis]|uniref:Uncharacterized protein n=1 Tax=Canariomyces notabilis TaxID=2074819 RepID=A0AAN6QEZ7_9PEZI|nr:hypothetical protein N656DRAFT_717007 [Canariomyces arenarius]